jgi:hypothetical protein
MGVFIDPPKKVLGLNLKAGLPIILIPDYKGMVRIRGNPEGVCAPAPVLVAPGFLPILYFNANGAKSKNAKYTIINLLWFPYYK